jgi:hypothetical protein
MPLNINRLTLKEISKNEHYLLGFHRIRAAGRNSKIGFEDYAKLYLTKDTFANTDICSYSFW